MLKDITLGQYFPGRSPLHRMDPRTKLLIERALEVSQRTDGAFDITVAPLTDLWKTCGERGSLPTTEELSSALALAPQEAADSIQSLIEQKAYINQDNYTAVIIAC